jgi:hypothetical protein
MVTVNVSDEFALMKKPAWTERVMGWKKNYLARET